MNDQDLLLWDVICIDGKGNPPQPSSAILVRGSQIVRVGQTCDAWPSEAVRLDGKGHRVIIPGIIDAHVHLQSGIEPGDLGDVGYLHDDELLKRSLQNARAALLQGVTTLCDCGGRSGPSLACRKASRSESSRLPRILVSLSPLTRREGHCSEFGYEAEDAGAMREAVKRHVAAGADVIKIMASGGSGRNERFPPWQAQYDVGALEGAVDEARRVGRCVIAHARGVEAIRNCIAASVDVISHCTWETPEGHRYDAELTEEIAARGIAVDPTVVAGFNAARSPAIPAARRRRLQDVLPVRYAQWRAMWTAGVCMLGGSDAGTPFVYFDQPKMTARLLVDEIGMSKVAAISALTGSAARALGLEHLTGTVEAGKMADLLLLRGNEATDLAAMLTDVEAIMLNGRWVQA